jgi:hypothetical protein
MQIEQNFMAILFQWDITPKDAEPLNAFWSWRDSLKDCLISNPDQVKDLMGSTFDGLQQDLCTLAELNSKDGKTIILIVHTVDKQLQSIKLEHSFLIEVLSALLLRAKSLWTRFLVQI